MADFACRTADGLRRAAPKAAAALAEQEMWELYTGMERPLSLVLYDM